jgi:hypothetical protein
MAKRALRVRVEIVSSPDGPVEARPGRLMVVPPHVTFADFGLAVDRAFGRWDLDYFRMFRCETEGVGVGAPLGWTERVVAKLRPGDVVRYETDTGWEHECTVQCYDDVLEAFGRETDRAHAILGWGAVPDQRGHTEAPVAADPGAPEPLWPQLARLRHLDLTEVRRATHAADLPALVHAVTGCDLRHALQQVGGALLAVLRESGGSQTVGLTESGAEAVKLLASIGARLAERGWAGDAALTEEIDSELLATESALRPLAVHVSELIDIMSSGGEFRSEGRLNLDTGEIATEDPFGDRFDSYSDDEGDDDEGTAGMQEWTNVAYIESGGRDGWYDMADFAELQHDLNIADRLARAIEGRGAFRRFRDAIDQLDLVEAWLEFSNDRELGRARKFLAEEGVRPL